MFKKLVLIAVVLTALLAIAIPAFAATNLCDPPPTSSNPNRTLRITCYVDPSDPDTTEMGTKDQPFKDANKAIAAAQAHPYGGYVYNVQTGLSQYYGYVNPPPTGTPISHTAMFVLLGLASLILVAAGWLLRRRGRVLPSQA
jgi:LPXTG-motif cell wall-anchored protein